jgi:hypothetical protein
MVIIDPYIAFYRFIDDKILVYRILHGARKYSHLLKDIIKFILKKSLYMIRSRRCAGKREPYKIALFQCKTPMPT